MSNLNWWVIILSKIKISSITLIYLFKIKIKLNLKFIQKSENKAFITAFRSNESRFVENSYSGIQNGAS